MKLMNIDEVYDSIGHLGYAQFIYFFSLSMLQIFIAQHMLLNIYTGLSPTSFVCHKKDETDSNSPILYNECFENSASKCSFHYNSSYVSFANEWDFVCDKKYKVALVQSIWMGGVMVGALLLSGLADRFGRLKALMGSMMAVIGFEGFSAFAASFNIMIMLRFLGGMACSVLILSSFVLLQELIGSSRRSFCAIFMTSFFSIGIAALSALAAYLPDWRYLSMATAISGIVYLSIPFYVPESPRWLVGAGRSKEAKKVLEMIAEQNGTRQMLPTHWNLTGAQKTSESSRGQTLCDLTSNSYLLVVTLIQVYSWFVNSLVYYGMTMAASEADDVNIYWATTFSGLIEIPSYFLSIFIIDRWGRRFGLCFFMLLSGGVCMVIPLVPNRFVSAFALVGKLGISASFAIIYLHSSEIFPTVIRNSAMGVVSVATRVGGVVSPFVLLLSSISPKLHFVVLGLLSVAAGMLNMKLPETLGKGMPETIQDMIALGQTRSKLLENVSDWHSVEGGKAYKRLQTDGDHLVSDGSDAEDVGV